MVDDLLVRLPAPAITFALLLGGLVLWGLVGRPLMRYLQRHEERKRRR